jgi:hypothetical protein
MERISEKEVRSEASRGKNEPLAKTPKAVPGQNGETRPPREAAKQQPGTDEAKDAHRQG